MREVVRMRENSVSYTDFIIREHTPNPRQFFSGFRQIKNLERKSCVACGIQAIKERFITLFMTLISFA